MCVEEVSLGMLKWKLLDREVLPNHSNQNQMLNKSVRAILLIAFVSGVTACSGVPLIPGI